MIEHEVKGVVLVDINKKGASDVSNWRTRRPNISNSTCTACGLCKMYCPEAAITRDGNLKPVFDLRFCKGCGICAYECPVDAIKMVEEDEKH